MLERYEQEKTMGDYFYTVLEILTRYVFRFYFRHITGTHLRKKCDDRSSGFQKKLWHL